MPTVVLTPAQRAEVNRSRVGIVSGGPGGLYAPLAADLQSLVEADCTTPPLRVVNVFGRGSVGNLEDLLNLERIDMAIVQSDVLAHFLRVNPEEGVRIQRDIRVLATLHREEVHLLARDGIRSLDELRGRRINVDTSGSGSRMTAYTLLRAYGLVSARGEDFIPDTGSAAQAVPRLLSGELHALLHVVGRGSARFAGIDPDQRRAADLQFVPLAQRSGLGSLEPSQLENRQYRSLVRPDEPVPTLAVRAVLATFAFPEGPRKAMIDRFVDKFFRNAGRLVARDSGFRTSEWCQAELLGQVDGWRPYEPALLWVERNRATPTRLAEYRGADCAGR